MALPGVYPIFQHWAQQTVWIYSDPHFGDKALAAGVPDRPSDEEQIRILNSCVGRKDTLIVLGDVGDIEAMRKVRGYKVLICGNHDIGHTAYAEVFNEIYTGALIIGEKLVLSHEPVDIPWLFNLHGHVHDRKHKNDDNHFNCCSDYIGYKPINFNQFLKSGPTARIKPIHRITIDKATVRKRKKGGK